MLVVVGGQLGQALVGLVAAQPHRVLGDEDVRPFGDGLAERDELEVGGVKRVGIGRDARGVAGRRAVAPRREGDHVVLVAVHVHALEEPGVAGAAVRDADAVFHGAERAAQASAQPQRGRAVDAVHRLNVGEPGADRRLAQAAAARADVLRRALRAGQGHVAHVEQLGAEIAGAQVARIPELQPHRVVVQGRHAHDVVEELGILADLERSAAEVDVEDSQLGAVRGLPGPGLQPLQDAVAVEVGGDMRLVEERQLAVHVDDVGHAVEVGVQAGQAVAATAVTGVAHVELAGRVEQVCRPHADGEDKLHRTGAAKHGFWFARPARHRLLVLQEHVGEFLLDGRVPDVVQPDGQAVLAARVQGLAGRVAREAAVGVDVLVPVLRLVPVAVPDLLGDVDAVGEHLVVEAAPLVLVKGEALGQVGRVPGDAIHARGLGVLGVEDTGEVGIRGVLGHGARHGIRDAGLQAGSGVHDVIRARAVVAAPVDPQGVEGRRRLRARIAGASQPHDDTKR